MTFWKTVGAVIVGWFITAVIVTAAYVYIAISTIAEKVPSVPDLPS